MSRLLIAATALAMTATTAVAAPGFGAMSASQSTQRADSETVGLLALLASFFSVEFSFAEAGAPGSERQRSVGAASDECEQAKTARDQEKSGTEQAAGHQGPDPMLLAF